MTAQMKRMLILYFFVILIAAMVSGCTYSGVAEATNNAAASSETGVPTTQPSTKQDEMPSSSSVSPVKSAQAVLGSIVSGETVAMTMTTANGGGGRYEVSAEAGNGPNRVIYFTVVFNWSFVDSGQSPPQTAASLQLESLDGTAVIKCWQGSDLLLCTQDGESFWLSAEAASSADGTDDTIFAFLRFWYDEAEISSLRGDIIIPDHGQSYQEIAQAWTDAYEGAMLRATSGSKFACTYVKTTASVDKDAMDSWYPEKILENKHFYFDYSTVFVPENDLAKGWLMAGNTVDYLGADAPAGAFEYFHMGPMYLTNEGWRCDGAGTGP